MLIDDMLNLSRMSRAEMRRECVDLSAMARAIAGDLQTAEPQRAVNFVVEDGLEVRGDSHLLRVVLDNLLTNAWKYTSKHDNARIELRKTRSNGDTAFFVRDDGAGFDAKYADKLFGVFQRLHGASEFPATGVGLATNESFSDTGGGSGLKEQWKKGQLFISPYETARKTR